MFSPINICLSFHRVSSVLFKSDHSTNLTNRNTSKCAQGCESFRRCTHTHIKGTLTDGFLLSESNVTLWRIQASCMSSGWILHKAFGKLSSYEYEVVFLSVFVAMWLSIFDVCACVFLHSICDSVLACCVCLCVCVCVRPRPPKHSHILQITGLGTRRIISLWMWPLALL